MKKITAYTLVLISVVFSGCKPQAIDIHPASLVGSWKAEFTTKIHPNPLLPEIERDVNVTVGITTETNGTANFEEIETIQNDRIPQTETVSGAWKQADDYLIIERPNGGFVAFRISSQSPNQLTVFSRTGETIQFNRIP